MVGLDLRDLFQPKKLCDSKRKLAYNYLLVPIDTDKPSGHSPHSSDFQ